MRLENRVGIVTGAGRNIGEAVAHSFANEGARVAVVDIREEPAKAVAEAINKARPGSALAIAADMSASVEVQRMVASVVDHWGSIDILYPRPLSFSTQYSFLSTKLRSAFSCQLFAAYCL